MHSNDRFSLSLSLCVCIRLNDEKPMRCRVFQQQHKRKRLNDTKFIGFIHARNTHTHEREQQKRECKETAKRTWNRHQRDHATRPITMQWRNRDDNKCEPNETENPMSIVPWCVHFECSRFSSSDILIASRSVDLSVRATLWIYFIFINLNINNSLRTILNAFTNAKWEKYRK